MSISVPTTPVGQPNVAPSAGQPVAPVLPPRQTDMYGKGTILVDVTTCARCGATHKALCFAPLTRPLMLQDGPATLWAPCPTNLEPVLYRIAVQSDPTQDTNH